MYETIAEQIKNILIENGYDVLKNVKIIIVNTPIVKKNSMCHGFTKSIQDKNKINKINDTYQLITMIPEHIKISTANISLSNFVFVLLHEIVHCIAPVEASKKDINKCWKYDYHGDQFYKYFIELLKFAGKIKIFTITFITQNKFSKNTMRKIDNLDLYNNCIDIGKSELLNNTSNGIRVTLITNEKKKLFLAKNNEEIIEKIKKSIRIKNFKMYDGENNELFEKNIKNDMNIYIKK